MVRGQGVQEVPVASLKVHDALQNFKEGAHPETGVVPGEELQGSYERLGSAPIVVWERLDGTREVITGRHRLDLARRTGEQSIPAQVVREADGFTQDHAIIFDAESNIRDGKGTVRDYARYFANTRKVYANGEADARARGLLQTAKGRAGWDIGVNASDDLRALYLENKVSEPQTVAIARAAPGDAELQRVGVGYALKGRDPAFLSNVLQAVKSAPKVPGQTDLFGNSDSALRTAEAQAARASEIQSDIRKRITSASGASKYPDAARTLGVDVNDPAAVNAELARLRAELKRWDSWAMHPDLVQRTLGAPEPTRATGTLDVEPTPGTPTPDAPVVAVPKAKGTAAGGMAGIPVAQPGTSRPLPVPTSPRANLPARPEGFVGQDVAPAARTMVDAALSIRRAFSPASEGPAAAKTARSVRANAAEMARQTEVAAESLRTAHRYVNSLPEADRWDFVDRIENGQPQADPKLQVVANEVRRILDSRRDAIQALGTGKLAQFYRDYFPHIWEQPKDPNVWARIFGKRPLEGPKSFLKQRTIATTREGMALGLRPVTEDPLDLVLLKAREMDRYLMAQKVLAEAKADGRIKFGRATQPAPEGMVRIEGPTGEVWGGTQVKTAEAFDERVMNALQEVMKNLGVKYERPARIRGQAWGTAQQDVKVRAQAGGPENVVMHEIGHVLDHRYGLWDYLSKKGQVRVPGVKGARKTITQELRDLADLRFEGNEQNVEPSYKRYVRKRSEKVANALMAMLYAPEKFAQVAPTVKARLEMFFGQHPELKPFTQVKPSLVLGTRGYEIPAGGLILRGHWYADPQTALVLNNYLSPGLRGKPLYDVASASGNLMNMAQLGMSAYHLTFTSVDAATSKLALGIEQLVAGKPTDAVKSALSVPAAPGANYARGANLLREIVRPGTGTPEVQRLAAALEAGGGRARMDTFYSLRSGTAHGAAGRFFDAWKKGNYPGAALRLFPAAVETMSRPIMENIVPRMKLGIFADMARVELTRLTKEGKVAPNATPAEIRANDAVREAMSRAWDSVDNRMGQMVYDNLFWHKTLKDTSMLATRSLGWNLGTIRELGGAAVDVGRLPGRIKAGEPVMTHRIAYAMALPVVVGTIGAMMQYAMTGQGPQELKDYFFPRTGGTRPDGKPERVAIASYMKDLYHYATEPVKTVTNKLHPLLASIGQMWQNEDYYGTEIRNPDDPLVQQAGDLAKFVASQFLPFSIRNAQQRGAAGEGIAKQGQSFFGVTPAPASVDRTKAEKIISEYFQRVSPSGGRTQEQADAAALRRDLLARGRRGEAVFPDLARAVRDKKLTPRQAANIRRDMQFSASVTAFKKLPLEVAEKAYAAGTRDEQARWKPLLLEKRANATGGGGFHIPTSRSSFGIGSYKGG